MWSPWEWEHGILDEAVALLRNASKRSVPRKERSHQPEETTSFDKSAVVRAGGHLDEVSNRQEEERQVERQE